MGKKILNALNILLFLGAVLFNSQVYSKTVFKSEDEYLQLINTVDNTYTFNQLSNIIKDCETKFYKSKKISVALTTWLKENHKIYKDRGAIDVNQFRGYVIYSLKKFVPNHALLKYIKAELMFAHEQYNLATAAHTASIFSTNSEELIPLLTPLVNNDFNEEVDITTFELNYPIEHPTKLKKEVLETLKYFAKTSLKASGFLKNEGYKTVPSNETKTSIPSCCKSKAVKNNSGDITKSSNDLIPSTNREKTSFKASFLDQNGKKVKFNDLTGKPFVLTFFYTSCINPLKCAATISRLSNLQDIASSRDLENKLGIYAMSYDNYIDTPTVIKSYGEVYGINFSENTKFFTTPDGLNYNKIYEQLDVRVNYGSGTINQHGIQLYVFDKKGRIAKIIENEEWTAQLVSNYLVDLLNE